MVFKSLQPLCFRLIDLNPKPFVPLKKGCQCQSVLSPACHFQSFLAILLLVWFTKYTKLMSENTEIWNLNALCRCCHKDGYFKSLHDTFINENEVEVYAQMLWDTFNFEVQIEPYFALRWSLARGYSL